MIRFKFLIFYIHFLLFIIQQLALPDAIISIAKLCIALLYVISLVVYTQSPGKGFTVKELIILGALAILVLLKFVFIYSFNIPLVYWVLLCLMVTKMEWTQQELLALINQVAIIYFVVAVVLNYTPFHFLSVYEHRDLYNRFIPQIGRFIGLEGSPAGPDLLYTLVFIFNLFSGWKKQLFKLPMILSIIVLLWTASLSNIVAMVLAVIAYVIYPFRSSYAFLLMMTFSITVYAANRFGSGVLLAMDQFTSYRTSIWVSITNSLVQENSIGQWLFGRDELMQFESIFGEGFDANPHNLSLFTLQFLGVPAFLSIVFLICYKIRTMAKGKWFFITMFLVAYGVTNPMPFTLRGDPMVMYVFILCFVMYTQDIKKEKFGELKLTA